MKDKQERYNPLKNMKFESVFEAAEPEHGMCGTITVNGEKKKVCISESDSDYKEKKQEMLLNFHNSLRNVLDMINNSDMKNL